MRTFLLPFLLSTLFLGLPSILFSQVIVNAEIEEDEQTGIVDIQIVADNFTNIVGYQFGIYWDDDLIQFEELSYFGMQTMDNSNFGFKFVEYGHLMTVWVDVTASPFPPNGHILFSLRFKRKSSGDINIAFGKVGYSGPIEIFTKDLVYEEFSSTKNKIFRETKTVFGQIVLDANKDCLVQSEEEIDSVGVIKFDGEFNFYGVLYNGHYWVSLPYGEYEVKHIFSAEETDFKACIPERKITITEAIDRIELDHLIQSDNIPIPSDPVSENNQDIGIENGAGGASGNCDNCDVSGFPNDNNETKNTTWLPEGTTWHYTVTTWGRRALVNEYQLTGKTTLQNKECSIIEKSAGSCDLRPQLDYIYKEDDRLYYFDEHKEAFQLLYDFSVGVGEVYKVPIWEGLSEWRGDTLHIRVDSISTFLVDTLPLKHFFVTYGFLWADTLHYFERSQPIEIIEDIGNLKNFFHLVENGFCDGLQTDPLRCFTHPVYGTISFIDERCDTLIRTSPTQELLNQQGKIYPNPVGQQLFVELPYQGFANWNIYNLNGQVLSSGSKEIQRNSPFSIPVENLPSSLYYIALFDEDQQLLRKQKFVKL